MHHKRPRCPTLIPSLTASTLLFIITSTVAYGRPVAGASPFVSDAAAFASAPVAGTLSGPTVGPTPPDYEFIIERTWLKMSDGVRLSVTYLKPTPATPGEKFPVLLDLYPYRKDEYPDSHPAYFARRGYIMATIDVRGTGSSEGATPPREYSEQELADAVEIIDLLSKVEGSNGRVGMWGKSWGGFNSIQVAMRNPPALKAILATEATDDLYHDDVHHMDGAFHLDQFIPFMDNEASMPQTPGYEMDEAYFRDRFNHYPWFLTYTKNQLDGEFWRRNSLRWQYEKMQIPSYLIGGLLDGYRDSVPRMLANVKAPVRAAMGPYKHDWPDNGVPGPNYEWRYEAVRWWDYWLKDRNTGIMDDPPLWIFVREGHGPDINLKTTPGHWIGTEWPISGTEWKRLYPSDYRVLKDLPGDRAEQSLRYAPSYGLETGLWWGEPTGDMRPDDAGSMVFDSAVVEEAFEIVGFPKVRLRVSTDAPTAHWVARLEDVQPDGTVSLVGGMLLNGSQRRSRLEPEPLVPGKVYDLEFDMHFTTWTFRPGHRIRLSVSNSLWPMIWPTPHPMTSKLYLGVEPTRIELPVIPARKYRTPEFRPPEPHERIGEGEYSASVPWPFGVFEHKRSVRTGTFSLEWKGYSDFENHGNRYHTYERNYYQTKDSSPAESRFEGEGGRSVDLGDRVIEIRSTVDVRSDEKNFHVKIVRYAYENGVLLRKREWSETIPRMFN